MKTIAVLLSGCGYLDGAEITEAVLSYLALDRCGVNVKSFAPNEEQFHVVDHSSSTPVERQTRNTLQEAARITRGQIQNLSELNLEEFDGLVIPGGFGVAKNLCDFAFKGSAGVVQSLVKKTINDFHDSKKPIAGICIAPALIAMSLDGKGSPQLTVGDDPETMAEIEKTGATLVSKQVDEICVDEENLIATTPAYMFDGAKRDKIFCGIEACIKQVVDWA
ncbi:MAG: isoprenoid biosynthesis glyoxalase ElbB [Bacteriovoracaceae bacterium]|jgi:enhancing lycopene biosynthesis protein 2|nr:isoprenoid biosynthesis glyoxalase ElbB [Bacteriovoracaceae bacterium]